MNKTKSLFKKTIYTLILMIIGLFIFKWYPMSIYGKDILYDASAHIVFASFILYFIYLLIEKNKSWKIPYLTFYFIILIVLSFQRIKYNAHNYIGIILGFLISLTSILIPNWKIVKNKIKF